MEFAYKKLLSEHNLKVSELSVDAQNGIDTITAMERSVNMALKLNKKVTDKTYSKIKSNDKWVCLEILEQLDGTQRNDDDTAPNTVDSVEDQIAKDNAEITKNAGIDTELNAILLAGGSSLPLSELKDKAPKAYNIIFDSYEVGKENGLITTNFKLMETEKEIFTLTKN